MSALNISVADHLFVAWTIALKDIGDALRNKNSRTNILLIAGLVVFFYWGTTIRPWDRSVDVVVYDQTQTGSLPQEVVLEDGHTLAFYAASSLRDMETKMGYKQLGIVLPADFYKLLEAGEEPILQGHILWVQRSKAAELESKYSGMFTELFNHPVRVSIGNNVVVPSPGVQASTVHFTILLATFWTAVALIPQLMLEEKQARTMDALMVSPAGPGQIVLGKALAGLFYVLLGGGLYFALHWAYITNWTLAIFAFVASAAFGIGLALAMGNFISSSQQLAFWSFPVTVVLFIPALFVKEPNLATGLKAIFQWLPTSAIVNLLHFALSSSSPADELLFNSAVIVASLALVYGLVVWQVRRADR